MGASDMCGPQTVPCELSAGRLSEHEEVCSSHASTSATTDCTSAATDWTSDDAAIEKSSALSPKESTDAESAREPTSTMHVENQNILQRADEKMNAAFESA